MAHRLQKMPDYFNEDEADAPVDASTSYSTRMAFRFMLKTGLRASEALALRRVDMRLDQDRRLPWCGPTRRETRRARAGRSRCRPT